MRYRLSVVLLFLLFCQSSKVFSQLNATTIGSATDQGGNCYLITPDALNQSGGVWYNNAIDFTSDFTIYYQAFFGTKDADGADGTALVFKRDPTPVIGGVGGGIGYAGISNALIIEFDTFQNISPFNNNDPITDHIAIIRDGNADHGQPTNLAGPVQASATSINIEDGRNHEVKIDWEAASQTLQVFFDCSLRLTLIEDVRNTIFSGDNSIFFGFVGSTGGLSNLNSVCFNSLSFVDNLVLGNTAICLGDSLDTVDASIPSGVTYSWSPTTGVSNPNISNPTFSPTTDTTYTVTIGDICGETTTEDFTIQVLPLDTPVFNPIAPICEGDGPSPLPTSSANGITGTWSPAFDNTATTNYTFTPNPGQCALSTNLTVTIIPSIVPSFDAIAPICPGDALAPLPTIANNGITGSWSPALNNMMTTSYTFTPDPGQGCTVSTAIEIRVEGQTPIFDAYPSFCSGEDIPTLPVVSRNGISGTWSPLLNNTTTTTYTFTPTSGECAFATTLEIVIVQPGNLQITTEVTAPDFSDQQQIAVNVTGGTPPFEYRLNNGPWQESNILNQVDDCLNTVFVRQSDQCSNVPEASVLVLTFPKFFTPNGDSFNDTWNVSCLEDDASARVSIFDRYGTLMTQFNTTDVGWDGRFNNSQMPSNDYWFVLEYVSNEGQPKTFKSNFALKR